MNTIIKTKAVKGKFKFILLIGPLFFILFTFSSVGFSQLAEKDQYMTSQVFKPEIFSFSELLFMSDEVLMRQIKSDIIISDLPIEILKSNFSHKDGVTYISYADFINMNPNESRTILITPKDYMLFMPYYLQHSDSWPLTLVTTGQI